MEESLKNNEKHSLKRRLEVYETLFDSLIDVSNYGIWEWDLTTFKFSANEKWSKIVSKIPPSVIYPADLKTFVYDKDFACELKKFLEFLKGDGTRYQMRYRISNDTGKEIWVINNIFIFRDGNGQAVEAVGSIIDERVEETCKLKMMNGRVSRVLSRITLLSIIKEEVENDYDILRQHVLFIIDINSFHLINEQYGYSIGDIVLKEINGRLNELSSSRLFAGRWESSKFVVFVKNMAHITEVDLTAKHIFSIFSKPFNVKNKQIHITLSMGVAVANSDIRTLDQLLNCAFIALNHVKGKGQGNRYKLFKKSMLMNAAQREKIVNLLEHFEIKNNLMVYYQPQYDSKSQKWYGFEALLRLKDDEGNFIPPSEFIPIAEETGLIISIGYWCIRECCRTIKRFQKLGIEPSTIAINISLVQLMSSGFVEGVKSIITEEGLSPSCIEFEITESILMRSVEYGADLLRQLKDFGISIVLDDFGSGYSSLNYIRALSIDTLKIDKTFIDGICTDEKSKCIVEMILNLAKKISLKVVAEGVETKEQIDELKKLACPIIQGYYYSRPIPEEKVISLFAK